MRTCDDVRDHGARLWDALVQTGEHALATDLAPGLPRRPAPDRGHHHPRRPAAGPSTGSTVTDDGAELSPAAIRRLACDADIIPVVLGTHGEVLDVGRTHRLVTPALWRALVCRDRHCAFPGCTRPPVMCHAHHITHWADGGPTALDNLVLLCGHHHRIIHHTPWQVRLNPDDGRPEFLPTQARTHPPPPGSGSEPDGSKPGRREARGSGAARLRASTNRDARASSNGRRSHLSGRRSPNVGTSERRWRGGARASRNCPGDH